MFSNLFIINIYTFVGNFIIFKKYFINFIQRRNYTVKALKSVLRISQLHICCTCTSFDDNAEILLGGRGGGKNVSKYKPCEDLLLYSHIGTYTFHLPVFHNAH